MLIIDAINDMIGYVGESPLDPTDPDYAQHSLFESALRILNAASKSVQSKGWWFNTYQTTLTPVAGVITLASTILSVEVLRIRGDNHDYTVRDGVLFDLTDNTATLTRAVTANVRHLVPFEDLPETAAQFIAARAATRFVRAYDGDASKIASTATEEALAYIPFNGDQIRNAHVNLYATNSMGPILANNWYSRYRLR